MIHPVSAVLGGIALSSVVIRQIKARRFSVWPILSALLVLSSPIFIVPFILFVGFSGAQKRFERPHKVKSSALCAKCGKSLQSINAACPSCGSVK